jgi:hypothetical protein
MMQISNNGFRHKSLEKGDKKRDKKSGQATFLEHSKEISYLDHKWKGKSDNPLFEKSSLSLFSVFSPVELHAYQLLDLTKTRG